MSSVLLQAALSVSAVLQPEAKAESWALPNTGLNPPCKACSKPELWAVPTEEEELPRAPPDLLRNLLNPTVVQLLSMGKFSK